MRAGPNVCDRCGADVGESPLIALVSIGHRIGTREPWFRLELCEPCGASFKAWRDTKPEVRT